MGNLRPVVVISLCLSLSAVQAAKFQVPDPVIDADYASQPAIKVKLGKLLFWDKILSGNENISCATCHHTLTDTGDGLALPIGEGGAGLGIARNAGSGSDAVHERIPRNAQPVFNMGALEMTVLFHDGRVTKDDSHPSGFITPAGMDLPARLESTLAAQAMFPVTSGAEMAGQAGENAIADAATAGNLAGSDGVWAQLADRLKANTEYVDLFIETFADIDTAEDITYVHAANAIAAYQDKAFRANNSPFDRFLRGEKRFLSNAARKGKKLFYGKAGCADCHSGKFMTDLEFHALAVPQIGPGKGDGFNGHNDFGRERVTGDPADRYKFRTPPLRNVALTGPWGHDGAFNTLKGMVVHHLDSVASLHHYDRSQALASLPPREDLDAIDFDIMNDPASVEAIAAANELAAVNLSDRQIDDLLAFLISLTDSASIDIRAQTPFTVPSGLPVAD